MGTWQDITPRPRIVVPAGVPAGGALVVRVCGGLPGAHPFSQSTAAHMTHSQPLTSREEVSRVALTTDAVGTDMASDAAAQYYQVRSCYPCETVDCEPG